MKPEPSDDARPLGTADLFVLWAGAGIALPEIWAGGLVAPLGLAAGLAAVLIGHALGVIPLGLACVIGARHGVPAILSTRAALGLGGARVAAVLNVVQLVGWTAVMLWIGGQAAARIFPALGTREWTLICGALTTVWTLGGLRWWRRLQGVGVALLAGVSVWMTVLLFRQHGVGTLWAAPAAGGMSFMTGLDLVVAMPVSWLPLAADYARHARTAGGAFRGSVAGYFLASSWMYALGLAASIATGTDAPDTMLVGLLAGRGVLAALWVALASTLTTTFLDIHSGAISAQALLPRLPVRGLVTAVGLAGTALALIIDPTKYETFLLFIGSAFCPLFGVVLADYFAVRRGSLDGAALIEGRGIPAANLPGLVAWAAGFALYQALARLAPGVGASIPSMLFAAGLYVALARARTSAAGTGGTAAG